MKAISIVLTLLLGVGFLAAAVWLSQAMPSPAKPQTKPGEQPAAQKDEAPIPKVAAIGPYPKAVALETDYDFGTMPQFGKGSHIFVIKNEGEAPLEVVARESDTTCQCTVGKVANNNAVPPGGETTVELQWEIKAPVQKFRHTAKIRTNDPENQVIEMAITGKVDQEFHLQPENLWDMGGVTSDKPAHATGILYSRMKDQFDITEVVCRNPRVKCTWKPLEPDELKKVEALSGYELAVDVDMSNVVGSFRESVEIMTADSETPAARFDVKARKPGPYEFMARGWDPENSRLWIGEFPAIQGKTAEVSVYLRLDDDVQLLSAESEHQAVKATWTKDEKFQAKSNTKRYLLKLEVLPGPAINRLQGDAEKVHLKFDHPEMGALTISVAYLSI